jgi:alpha-galactosidase
MRTSLGLAVLALTRLPPAAHSATDGVAVRPPMGWRSWNAYQCDISQAVMEASFAVLVDTSRLVNGVPTSLRDVGYTDAGVDDCC